jgi:hypothetical protein
MSDIIPAPQCMPITTRTVRELKGAPLACLILLNIAGQPVSNEWLCMMAGYTDKTIAQAMKLLSSPEYQFAKKARGGWVANHERQLVLGEISESRKNSVPTTTTLLINKDSNSEIVVVAGRKNSDSLYEANMEACKKAGIGEPSASKISDLEYVTPDFIAAHVESLKSGETRGLAIRRIEYNELPSVWEKKEISVGKLESTLSKKVAALRARASAVDDDGFEEDE